MGAKKIDQANSNSAGKTGTAGLASSSPLEVAATALREAQEHIMVVAHQRAAKQLSIAALSAIVRDLQQIERKLAAYDYH